MLALQFSQGSGDAYSQIFNDYYTPVCYYAMQIIGQLEDAEDIVMETFNKLFEQKGDFNTLANIRGFLYRTTRNACYNYRKSKTVRIKAQQKLLYTAQQVEKEIEMELLDAMLIKKVLAAVDSLPEDRRTVFKMIYYEGMETKLIAQRLGISVDTVRSHKRHAIQMLKTKLSEKQLVAAWALYLCIFQYSSAHSFLPVN